MKPGDMHQHDDEPPNPFVRLRNRPNDKDKRLALTVSSKGRCLQPLRAVHFLKPLKDRAMLPLDPKNAAVHFDAAVYVSHADFARETLRIFF